MQYCISRGTGEDYANYIWKYKIKEGGGGGGRGESNATSTAYEREMVLTFDQVIS